MSITDKMWSGITAVIKMDAKVEGLTSAIVDQQQKIETLTGRVITLEARLNTYVEIAQNQRVIQKKD